MSSRNTDLNDTDEAAWDAWQSEPPDNELAELRAAYAQANESTLSWANMAGRLTRERDQARADADLLLASLAARDQDVVRLDAEIARLRTTLVTIASGEHRNPAFTQHCGCMALYARKVLGQE